MIRLRQALTCSIALCCSAAVAAQGRPARPHAVQPLVLKITTLLEGRVVEVENPKTKQKEKRRVDRKTEWALGKETLTSVKTLRQALHRITADPASLRPDPTTGGKVLPALRLAPGPNVQWAELLQALDAGKASGFRSVDFDGVGSSFLAPKAIADPVVSKTDLIVPGCVFCEPDELPSVDRPTIDVHRDGRVVIEGRKAFEWQAGKEDLAPLRAELRQLRSSMEKKGRVEDQPGSDASRISVPVLIRVDREAAWRDARRVLSELTRPEVGFWKLELAVSETSSRMR